MIPPRRGQTNRGPMPGPRRSRGFSLLRLKGPRAKIRQSWFFVHRMLLPWWRARRSLARLDLLMGSARRSSAGGIVLVAAHYGTHAIVDAFLDHHRALGVREFVLLDLSSAGGLAQHIAGQAGCAVWRPRDLSRPDEITSWLNGLRCRYASGRWCLSLDTADAFVYYRCETRGIGDLTDFLESESRDHLFALVVDMYGDGAAADDRDPAGGSGELRYFDPFGFVTLDPGRARNVIVRGGPQRRLLFKNRPRQSPALNRIPLVKWAWPYAYVAGTRLIVPVYLNNPHAQWHSSPTGCILRFALAQDAEALHDAARWEAPVAMMDGGLASYPGLQRLRELTLKQDCSRPYRESRDLVDAGLMNPGQWF